MEVLAVRRKVNGAIVTHVIDDADDKLRWRAELPGASTWDRAAAMLRALQEIPDPPIAPKAFLPLACPASWCVNSGITSTGVQSWLASPKVEAWEALLSLLGERMTPAEWLASGDRAGVLAAVTVLATGFEGESVASVTKTLALLRPRLVPLMDDAAAWFALELVPQPTTARTPALPPTGFVPMLDWFAEQVVANEALLSELKQRHPPLDRAQCLDRLVWMESWGNRVRSGEISE